MKYVGEAVKEHGTTKDRVILLGITNWTTVSNKEILCKDFYSPVVNKYYIFKSNLFLLLNRLINSI